MNNINHEIAERIAATLEGTGQIGFSTEHDAERYGPDALLIQERYRQLSLTMSFGEALRTARVEYIERVLNETRAS